MPLAIPEHLSAKFKASFAYKTVKDRLPVILTKVVDAAFRQRHEIKIIHGEIGCEDLKAVCGFLSEMRYRLSTDKPLTPVAGSRSDVIAWNRRLDDYQATSGQAPSWFKSPWLLIECYMYRKMIEAFECSQMLKTFDPFGIQKEQAFVGALPAIRILAQHTIELVSNAQTVADTSLKKANFLNLVQICLWGNKCDLSISSGENSHHVACPLKQVDNLKPFILVDDSERVYDYLANKSAKKRVDFVLDNAGLEFFGDLCFAEFLLSFGFAETVVFHAKAMPWFISDVTARDFTWTLEMLNASSEKDLAHLGSRWCKREADGSFQIRIDDFWTLPDAYYLMAQNAPELYAELQKSDLVVFKGDLNYRKLVGDLNWPTTTKFVDALRGFAPTPFVVLRTLKADVVVGLGENVGKELEEKDKDWMISGDYAVISCSIE